MTFIHVAIARLSRKPSMGWLHFPAGDIKVIDLLIDCILIQRARARD